MDYVHIGVGVLIERDNKILLGKKLSDHGHGTWCFPGGKPDHFEDMEQTAVRETKEETDLDVKNLKYLFFTNDKFEESGKHYITLFYKGDAKGEPKIMEPDKMVEWNWFEWDNLPKPLFLSTVNFLKKYRETSE